MLRRQVGRSCHAVLLRLSDDLCRVSLHNGLDALPEVRGSLALGCRRVCGSQCADKSNGFLARAPVVLNGKGQDSQLGVTVAFAVGCLKCCMSVVLCSGPEEIMLCSQGGHDGHIHVRVGSRVLRYKIDPVLVMVCRCRGCVLFQEAWESKVVSCVLIQEPRDGVMPPHDTSSHVACGCVVAEIVQAGPAHGRGADRLVGAGLSDRPSPGVAGPGDTESSPQAEGEVFRCHFVLGMCGGGRSQAPAPGPPHARTLVACLGSVSVAFCRKLARPESCIARVSLRCNPVCGGRTGPSQFWCGSLGASRLTCAEAVWSGALTS